MATTRIADHLGRVLDGRYRLLAPIGTGASAHVFLADDVRLGRRVAVKMLHPALADDAAFLKRFRAEARAAAALSHPHILAIYDWGEEAEGPYIVTEYLGGGSLRSMLDRGTRLSPSQSLLVGLEAARALDFAHRRGFVHRDIKPANLLFDDEGRLRVADFGLARALAEASWTEPTGGVMGSARYASPEQAQGRTVDGKSDVYALALVLVEAVTGRLPFDSDTAVATLMSRVSTPVEVPDSLGPLVPVLQAAGRVDPAERSDAMALGAGLQKVSSQLDPPEPLAVAGPATLDDTVIASLTGEPTDLNPGGAEGPTTATPAVVPDEVSTPRRRRRGRSGPPGGLSRRAGRRRRWPLAVLAALVVAAAGVGAYALVQAQLPSHDVPRVIDLQQSEATAALEQLDFEVEAITDYVDGTEVGQVTGQRPDPGTSLREGRTVTLMVSLGPPPVDIPSLEELNEEEATARLAEAGLAVAPDVQRPHHEEIPAGQVMDWSPRDQQLPKGAEVSLVVSAGPAPRPVPEVAGLKENEAVKAITDLGLVVEKVEGYSDNIAKGVVARTEPVAGEPVARGGTVRVIVSLGQPQVPKLKGLTVDEARAALEAVGLELGSIQGFGGRVEVSSPTQGTTVRLGTEVAVLTGFS